MPHIFYVVFLDIVHLLGRLNKQTNTGEQDRTRMYTSFVRPDLHAPRYGVYQLMAVRQTQMV